MPELGSFCLEKGKENNNNEGKFLVHQSRPVKQLISIINWNGKGGLMGGGWKVDRDLVVFLFLYLCFPSSQFQFMRAEKKVHVDTSHPSQFPPDFNPPCFCEHVFLPI
jgi:hypothetical protein